MDGVLFVVGSGAKQLMHAQAVNSHNLANVNTIGFQADLANFRTQVVNGAGQRLIASRMMRTDHGPGA